MNFPFYIARRYLFAKKSTNAINAISVISVTGIAVATMALVIVLSVFNGFSDLVGTLLTNFDPQLKVVPLQGKTAAADDPVLESVRQMPEVLIATDCVEDIALAVYEGKQQMVTVMGVDDNFKKLTRIDDILYGDGQFMLSDDGLQYGIPGIRLADNLGILAHWGGWLRIFAPQKEGQPDLSNPMEALVCDSLLSPGVVFGVNQGRYDTDHILTSVSFARMLFGEQGRVSSLQLKLKDTRMVGRVKKRINQLAPDRFKALDRYEQQEDTFHIMQIEKYLAYLFLTFILLVACFNIVGTLSMLIIEKRDDTQTLRSMGADDQHITRIFLYEGRIITVIGAVAGTLVGLLLCLLQQVFGTVKLGASSGSYIVDAYPVSVHAADVLLIVATVIAVGWLSVWYPVRYLSKRLL
ncbi:MAG: FtsX-like permease family protein [Prevotella sp.]|nr:FtsX-like permease family protein [Prevotella sp.]